MSKSELSTKFAEMCNHGLDKFPRSATLFLVRKGVSIMSSAAPEWFISYVGPFFWDKRREIAADDIDFFVNRSWSEQYESWGFLGSALASPWENTIKESLQYLYANDRDALKTIPKSLVAMYARYLQLCQAE